MSQPPAKKARLEASDVDSASESSYWSWRPIQKMSDWFGKKRSEFSLDRCYHKVLEATSPKKIKDTFGYWTSGVTYPTNGTQKEVNSRESEKDATTFPHHRGSYQGQNLHPSTSFVPVVNVADMNNRPQPQMRQQMSHPSHFQHGIAHHSIPYMTPHHKFSPSYAVPHDFSELDYVFPFQDFYRRPDQMQFRSLPPRSPSQTVNPVGSPSRSIGQRMQPRYKQQSQKKSAVNPNGYKPLYEKVYKRNPRNTNRISKTVLKKRLTARESIDLEEKAKYAELVKKYCSQQPLTGNVTARPPLNTSRLQNTNGHNGSYLESGKSFGSCTVKSNGAFFQQKIPIEELMTPRNTSANLKTKMTHIKVEPTKKIQEPEVIDLTEKTYSILQTKRKSRLSSDSYKTISDVESLGSSRLLSEQSEVQSNGSLSSRNKSSDESTLLFRKKMSSPVCSAFKDTLKSSKYISESWFDGIKEKYSSEARKTERQSKEEEEKVKFYRGRREEWEKQLEDRLKHRLRISEREPPVLAYEYESEEEEEEGLPELSDDMEAVINNGLRSSPSSEVLADKFNLRITRQDLRTLGGSNWLNDEVINFYMNLIMDRGEQDNRPKVHAFNTFFYGKVMSGGQKSVRRWTKKFDIFQKDYIVVPVHLQVHWCLAVIDFRKKEIRYYDSMSGTNNGCLNALKTYLEDESLDKKSKPYDTSDWKLTCVKDIPQQMNGYDCGVFACTFAEFITRDATVSFSQENMPYLRRKMVYEIITMKLLQ